MTRKGLSPPPFELFVLAAAAACSTLTAVLAQTNNNTTTNAPTTNAWRKPCTADYDIRNNPQDLTVLRDCEVVEGFLQIVLMDTVQPGAFEGLSFPKLREVASYLLVWKVNGLLSLGQLFPNLSVIRGSQLYDNKYALVVFDVPHLTELGLQRLETVMHGSVRVSNNSELCLAETLDWDVIAPNADAANAPHTVIFNKEQGCAPCPCPGGRCWGYSSCRRPPSTPALVSPSGVRCHENCIVGCSGPNSFECTACSTLEHDGACVKACPNGTVAFLERRCVSPTWCESQKHRDAENGQLLRGLVFRNSCLRECPPGFLRSSHNAEANSTASTATKTRRRVRATCQPCTGPCHRKCNGAFLRSVKEAHYFKGCTFVNGTLEIEIANGTNVDKKLEPLLGNIRTIMGSLVVSRSRTLTSLHFLRSLRFIEGKDTNKDRTVLINDNDNLQYLFDWGDGRAGSKLAIDPAANVSFTFNPLLCPQEIEKFKEVTEMNKVVSNHNGFSNPCGSRILSFAVSVRGPESVVLTWPTWESHASAGVPRVLGYAVFVRPAARRNVTEYAPPNVCHSSDGWMVHDVRASSNETEVNQIIPELRPATLYAFYVKTYTTQSSLYSPIRYFRTRSDRPSPPLNAHVAQAAHGGARSVDGALVLAWDPPTRPNGILSHYVVTGDLRDDDSRQVNARDYCEHPFVANASGPAGPLPREDDAPPWPPCCCSPCCRELHEPLDDEQCERLLRPAADAVLGRCGKRVGRARSLMDRCAHALYTVVAESAKKGVSSHFPKLLGRDRDDINLGEELLSARGARWKRRFVEIVSADVTTAAVSALLPFGLYLVRVHACGQRDEEQNPAPLVDFCSAPALAAARAPPLRANDVVSEAAASVRDGALRLSWAEPAHPNGVVLAYYVRYRRGHQQHEQCTSRHRHRADNGTVRFPLTDDGGLDEVQIRAISLAGPGQWVNVRLDAGGDDVEDAKGAGPMAGPDVTDSSTSTAVAVVTLLLFVLALLSLGLYMQRRRDARDAQSALGDSRRLVGDDLTDCWDLPALPRDEDWVVQYRTEPVDGNVVIGLLSDDPACHVREPGASTPPPTTTTPESGVFPIKSDWEAIERHLERAQSHLMERSDFSLHPTNPFHPKYYGCAEHFAEADFSRRHDPLAGNPFVWDNLSEHELKADARTRPKTLGLEFLTAENDANFGKIAENMRSISETDSQENVAKGLCTPNSSTEELQRSCSTDSFLSVNLDKFPQDTDFLVQ